MQGKGAPSVNRSVGRSERKRAEAFSLPGRTNTRCAGFRLSTCVEKRAKDTQAPKQHAVGNLHTTAGSVMLQYANGRLYWLVGAGAVGHELESKRWSD